MGPEGQEADSWARDSPANCSMKDNFSTATSISSYCLTASVMAAPVNLAMAFMQGLLTTPTTIWFLAQYRLLTENLGVNHLRLVMGTSMGAMHTWVWGETYPDFMDTLMPLASNPVQIGGRNRVIRKMIMDLIRNDPDWQGGEYKTQPMRALTAVEDLMLLVGSAPLFWQKQSPTRDAADKFYQDRVRIAVVRRDANDLLYQLDCSREYNPAPKLELIKAPLVAINSADDFINPPELGIIEREIKKVKRGRYVLLPITDQTRGHGTHTIAAIWQGYLKELLDASAAK